MLDLVLHVFLEWRERAPRDGSKKDDSIKVNTTLKS